MERCQKYWLGLPSCDMSQEMACKMGGGKTTTFGSRLSPKRLSEQAALAREQISHLTAQLAGHPCSAVAWHPA